MTSRRWWIVSDLHLGTAEGDPRGTASAFARFLTEIAAAAGPGEVALVLLGDTFEMAGLDGTGARSRLGEIAARHPHVFTALRGCVARGVGVDVVVGNHDVDLARPAAVSRLRELLGDAEGANVRVYPWALHVPGLLFAEHGHQHHDVHRLPTMLLASVDNLVRMNPPALAVWSKRSGGPVATARAVSRALAAARAAERRARTPSYLSLVDAASARLGLSAEAGRALWRISAFRLVGTAAGIAGRVVGRRVDAGGGRASRPGHAPAEVAAALSRHGAPVRWYVSGHTHRASESVLDGTDTRYLNTGTWCSDVRGPGPDLEDPTRFPYVLVERPEEEPPMAVLGYWRDRAENALARHVSKAPVDCD
jgi:UDP-2,3-diacylglucosamine pyrophosphatase LpxH